MARTVPGRRWFVIGSWATIVTALLHTAGNTLSSPPPDPAYANLEATMRSYTIPLGLGMTPSMWDINQGLVFTMSICLAAMGGLGLLVARDDTAGRTVYRAALLLAASSIGLTILYYAYQITPAFISMVVVSSLFLAAILETRRHQR